MKTTKTIHCKINPALIIILTFFSTPIYPLNPINYASAFFLRQILPSTIVAWINNQPPLWNQQTTEESAAFKDLDFPPDFILGVGTSAYQVDGNCHHSSYATWPHKNPRYKELAGKACDHWNLYKEDIHLMRHELGVAASRFSVEWSRIEPHEGEFDQEALDHYAAVYVEYIRNGIQPFIGFHHYSDPQWFLDKGGFEQPKNKNLFVHFCTRVYQELNAAHSLASLPENLQPRWITFNSPASYAANGYLTGERPPGKKSMASMINVVKNMCAAHRAVYTTIKKDFPHAQIGITHNVYHLYPENPYNPLHRIKAHFGNALVHDIIYDFFINGGPRYTNPWKALWGAASTKKKCLDFICLNHYNHGLIGNKGAVPVPHEMKTDSSQYGICPPSMTLALREIHKELAHPLKIPIYITENGIATTDPVLRNMAIHHNLFAVKQAMNEGIPVKGYFYWSFMDNYEWKDGYSVCYGLYAVDRATLKRTFRGNLEDFYFVRLARRLNLKRSLLTPLS